MLATGLATRGCRKERGSRKRERETVIDREEGGGVDQRRVGTNCGLAGW